MFFFNKTKLIRVYLWPQRFSLRLRVSAVKAFEIRLMVPLVIGFLFSSCGVSLGSSITGSLIRVIDGDSLLVNNGGIEENVRLIGIDAPESGDSPKAERDAAKNRETLGAVLTRGREASRFLKGLVRPGDSLRVETDVEQRDSYGRLLGYVYQSDGKLLNEKILQAGFAVPLTIRPNTRFWRQFQSAYESALKNKRGLWGKTAPMAGAPRSSRRKSGQRGRRRFEARPGPQTEVTGQRDVTEQNEVSGKAGHF